MLLPCCVLCPLAFASSYLFTTLLINNIVFNGFSWLQYYFTIISVVQKCPFSLQLIYFVFIVVTFIDIHRSKRALLFTLVQQNKTKLEERLVVLSKLLR